MTTSRNRKIPLRKHGGCYTATGQACCFTLYALLSLHSHIPYITVGIPIGIPTRSVWVCRARQWHHASVSSRRMVCHVPRLAYVFV